MFDGNYRTRGRTVNLASKRSASGSKRSALEESRVRREQRRIAAAKAVAATHFQRLWRGYRTRKALQRTWERTVQENLLVVGQTQQQAQISNSTDQVTSVLNALLRLKQEQQFDPEILQHYAGYIEKLPQQQQQQQQVPLAHRIVWATLATLTRLQVSQSRRILTYCLDLEQSSTTTTSTWNQLGGARGFERLIEVYYSNASNNAELQPLLYQILQLAAPDTIEGRGILAALALTKQEIHPTTIPSVLAVYQQSPTSTMGTIVRRLVSQHAATMLQSVVTYSSQRETGITDIAAAMQFLKAVLMENNDALVWTLNRVVRGDSLFTAGSSAPSATTNAMAAPNNGESDDDDDDDDDDEEVDFTRAHATTVEFKTPKTASYQRLTKYDLQTVPKLNRLFAIQVQKADQFYSSSSTPHQVQFLATIFSDPALWLHWGEVLFNDDDNSLPEDAIRAARQDFVTVLAILLQATTGLQARQNAQSSQLLNKLAFSLRFLEKLWKFIQQTAEPSNTFADAETASDTMYYSFSVFSDLFAHHLIALKDDTFLAEHTTADCVILAEDVIRLLQVLLHDLYWAKPVRASEFKLVLGAGSVWSSPAVAATTEEQGAAARARLLLTGTKLWNSLYERWCRLVRRNPFCEESTWWFPTMTTLSSDRAVVREGGGVSYRAISERFVEAMDVDSDSSTDDSDMEDADGGHTMRDEAEVESDALAEAFSDPKMARILTCIPQALPFSRRVKLFDSLLKADKMKSQDEEQESRQLMLAMMRGEEADFSVRPKVEIRRDNLYEDSMQELNHLGTKLKRRIQVTFINQHGAQEAGIDGGGVFKEFLDDLIKDAFSVANSTSTHQLFTVTPLETLKVNSDLVVDQSLLSHYEFLGRVLGKAVYESILVEPQFCLPFLNQLLGKSNSPEDLKNFDPEFYRNLTKLLNLPARELEGMGLTFELTVGSGPTARTVELIPGGRNIPVRKENVIQYIHLMSHMRLNVQSAQQTRAFLKGFRDLIPASWVRLFSAYELQKLISGDDSVKGIDVASFKQHMQYGGGYHPDQPIVKYFWEIIEEMSADQQHKLLKFMTSCSRQPLLGFGSLEPAPCIQQIRLPDHMFIQDDQARIFKQAPLPTSSTCMNLLKLPNYRSKELMRAKLLAAIESGAGFELT